MLGWWPIVRLGRGEEVMRVVLTCGGNGSGDCVEVKVSRRISRESSTVGCAAV